MNRALIPIAVCLYLTACGDRSGQGIQVGNAPPKPLRLPACFRLSYGEWGLPPHADGRSLRGARAPIGFQLRSDPPPRGFRSPEDSGRRLVLWVQESDDSLSATGSWEQIGDDSVEIGFPFMPGLYGMAGEFVRRGDLLVGEVRTYSDVMGTEQGRSQAVALPLLCTFPPAAPDPFAEDSSEAEPRPTR